MNGEDLGFINAVHGIENTDVALSPRKDGRAKRKALQDHNVAEDCSPSPRKKTTRTKADAGPNMNAGSPPTLSPGAKTVEDGTDGGPGGTNDGRASTGSSSASRASASGQSLSASEVSEVELPLLDTAGAPVDTKKTSLDELSNQLAVMNEELTNENISLTSNVERLRERVSAKEKEITELRTTMAELIRYADEDKIRIETIGRERDVLAQDKQRLIAETDGLRAERDLGKQLENLTSAISEIGAGTGRSAESVRNNDMISLVHQRASEVAKEVKHVTERIAQLECISGMLMQEVGGLKKQFEKQVSKAGQHDVSEEDLLICHEPADRLDFN